jgi:lipopolysaccharide biosynthesis regulator YciM
MKKYQYKCRNCGYTREELLDKPDYSWNCPKCGNYTDTYEIVEDNNELGNIK